MREKHESGCVCAICRALSAAGARPAPGDDLVRRQDVLDLVEMLLAQPTLDEPTLDRVKLGVMAATRVRSALPGAAASGREDEAREVAARTWEAAAAALWPANKEAPDGAEWAGNIDDYASERADERDYRQAQAFRAKTTALRVGAAA